MQHTRQNIHLCLHQCPFKLQLKHQLEHHSLSSRRPSVGHATVAVHNEGSPTMILNPNMNAVEENEGATTEKDIAWEPCADIMFVYSFLFQPRVKEFADAKEWMGMMKWEVCSLTTLRTILRDPFISGAHRTDLLCAPLIHKIVMSQPSRANYLVMEHGEARIIYWQPLEINIHTQSKLSRDFSKYPLELPPCRQISCWKTSRMIKHRPEFDRIRFSVNSMGEYWRGQHCRRQLKRRAIPKGKERKTISTMKKASEGLF
jgi:hypothetical protein